MYFKVKIILQLLFQNTWGVYSTRNSGALESPNKRHSENQDRIDNVTVFPVMSILLLFCQ